MLPQFMFMINLPDSPNLRMIKSGALGRERRPAGPRGSRWWEPLPRVTALHAKFDPRRLTMRSPELQVLPSFKPVVKVAYAPYQVPVDRAPRAPARRRALLRRRVPRGAPRGADRLRRGQGANGELKEVFEDVWVVEGLFRMGPLMHIKARPTPFSPPPPPQTHTRRPGLAAGHARCSRPRPAQRSMTVLRHAGELCIVNSVPPAALWTPRTRLPLGVALNPSQIHAGLSDIEGGGAGPAGCGHGARAGAARDGARPAARAARPC